MGKDLTRIESHFWGRSSQADLPVGFLKDAVSVASDLVIKLDRSGQIIDVFANPYASIIGSIEHWRGRSIDDVLTEESVPKLHAHIEALKSGKGEPIRVTELNHSDGTIVDVPIRYTLMPSPDLEYILLLGKDLTPVAKVQQDLVNAQLALEREYERLLGYESLYRAILDLSREAIVLVNAENGNVQSANAAALKLLGVSRAQFEDTAFAKHFSPSNLAARLAEIDHETAQPTPLNVKTKAGDAEVTITPRMLRLSGRIFALHTITPSGTSRKRSDERLLEQWKDLFERTSDAIVLVDTDKRIVSCNQSFLKMCDATTDSDIEGQAISEFLSRGSVDVKIITDKIAEVGHIKNYSVGIRSIFGTAQDTSASVTKFNDGSSLDLAFVFRPTPLARSEGNEGQVGSSDSFTKLVGSAPLKEIVAGTTDVIEKLCITAALDITNQNKVAAANLLGLSRQSLYEKLRKYELL